MDYKKLIHKMVDEIDNELALTRIYHYIQVKYRKYRVGKEEEEEQNHDKP